MAVDIPPRTTEGPAMALCASTPTPCQWFSQLADLLDARSAPRLIRLFLGAVLAAGRRTVTSWLRAAGIRHDFRSAYTTVAAVAKHTDLMAARLARSALQPMLAGTDRLLLGIDDTPTPRYGPEVEGAGLHHNPTPGPAGSPHLEVPRLGRTRFAGPTPLLGRRRSAAVGSPLRPQGHPAAHRPRPSASFPHQAGTGRRTGAMGRSLAEIGRPSLVGRGRRRLRQGAFPQAADRPRRHYSQSPAQGRRPLWPARTAPARSTRPPTALRRPTHQPGQTRRPTTRLATRRLRPVRQADDQGLQDVPSDVAAGRRSDPRRAGQGDARLDRLLLHQPGRQRRRRAGGGRRPLQPGDGLPRREGSGRGRPTAGAFYRGQHRSVPPVPVDLHHDRGVGLEPSRRRTGGAFGLAVGRREPSAVARRQAAGVASTIAGRGNNNASAGRPNRDGNRRGGTTLPPIDRLTTIKSRKVQIESNAGSMLSIFTGASKDWRLYNKPPETWTASLESVPEGGLTRLTQPWHTEVPCVPRLCQPCFDGLWDSHLANLAAQEWREYDRQPAVNIVVAAAPPG